MCYVTPLYSEDPDDENLDTDHDDAPLRLHAVGDIIGPAATSAYTARNLDLGDDNHQLFMVNAEELGCM
jgi:hypothetical protein